MTWLLKGEPKDAQVEALRRTASCPVGFAYFMEMGLGKTATVLAEFVALLAAGKVDKLIIFCPFTLTGNWDDEIQNWTGSSLRTQVWPWKSLDLSAHVYIVYYEALGVGGAKGVDFLKEILPQFRCYVALDESTQIKRHDAVRTKALLSQRPYMAFQRVLSGAPMVQGPQDIWSQMKFIGAFNGVNFFQFRNKFCKMGGFKGKKITGVNEERIGELNEIIDKHSFRAKKEDWTDLPAKITHVPRRVAHNAQQAKAYKGMLDEFLVLLGRDNAVEAHMVITQMVKLQQISSGFIIDGERKVHELVPPAQNAKLIELRRILDEEITGKVIVPTYFQYTSGMLLDNLSDYGAVAIIGGQSREETDEQKRKFNQDDDIRVMVCQSGTAKYGHTLLGTRNAPCSTTVFYENSFSLDDRIQMEDRNHRYGQKYTVNLIDIVSSEVEFKVIKALQKKRDIAGAIIDAVKSIRG